MKRITSFLILLLFSIGVTTGWAQETIVGTYDGGLTLEHMTGDIDAESDLTVTIWETEEGHINVTFPSFAILGKFATGEIIIEDVAVEAQADGSYSLSKDEFTISFTAGMMISSYPCSSLEGTIYSNGEAEIIVKAAQQPNANVFTTATFSGNIPDYTSPIAAAYGGDLTIKSLTGDESTEADQIVNITKATSSTVDVTFPSFTVLNFNTGNITIEDIAVSVTEEGSYALSNEQFTINITLPTGMTMDYPYSSLKGTVSADGEAEITVEVSQNPAIGALATATFKGKVLDSSVFVWGTATWNIEDGTEYSGTEEFQNAGLTLTYPNPTGYNLTFLNVIAAKCNIYMDEEEEPVEKSFTAQGSTAVAINYDFAEGHDYRIVVVEATLAQANLATFTTDTLTSTTDSYSISFSIKGPELQHTINVEAYMSLSIVDQNTDPTTSAIDVNEITSALGIADISEATMHPLNGNGSYNDHMDVFDWWRDANGEFTTYYSGWNTILGHNAYPAVYSIKTSEAGDYVTYYFYDYWTEYNPDDPEEIPGMGTETQAAAKRAVPETSYHSVIWDWEDKNGNVTQYKRNYRIDEGQDYEASTLFVANGKSVCIHATLHFVSQEEYEKITGITEAKAVQAGSGQTEYYSVNGIRLSGLQKGINIVREADGKVRKVLVK